MARFPSLQHGDKIAYMMKDAHYDAPDQWWRSACPQQWIAPWAFQYDTYGHGIAQHACEVLVKRENLADYCASLADFLLKSPLDIEHAAANWPRGIHMTHVKRFASIRYKEDKPQWYSSTQAMVSRSRAKANDRRWEEVPRYADGTAGAVYAMSDKHRPGALETFVCYEQILDHLDALEIKPEPGTYSKPISEFMNLDGIGLYSAVKAVDGLVRSYGAYEDAKRMMRNYDNCHRPSHVLEGTVAPEPVFANQRVIVYPSANPAAEPEGEVA